MAIITGDEIMGQKVITGSHVYHRDIFGVCVPEAKNKAYINRRNKMRQQLKEAAKNGEI